MSVLPNLRITKWTVAETETISATDYTVFLRRESPVFTKGRKTYSDFLDPETNDLVVKVTYTDVMNEGLLVGIEKEIAWYDSDNEIGLTKTVLSPLNKAEAASELRDRRIRSIDYLRAAGKGTPIEPFMNVIFAHYESTVRFWYDMGGDGLADAVNSETDPTILAYLAIETEPDWTVKTGILYQTDHPWD